MPSIFDIPLRETGGPDALTAFEYQHRIAVGELLRMAIDTDCDFIEFDSHDDILVRTTVGIGSQVEFVQVKSQASGNWTPSDLYSDDKGSSPTGTQHASSLVAKQLSRAVGDEAVAFRVVTRSEVNHDLAVLTQTAATRDASGLQKLKDNLVMRFADLTFPRGRTVGDWVDKVRWRVAGSEQAVDDRNLHSIAKVVFAHCNRTLTPAQAEELYKQLRSRAREAACISEPRGHKGCTRSQLLTWLWDYCAQLPVHYPPDVHTVLETLQREAQERCVGRWLNAGVRMEMAQELTADETVGANAMQWLQEQQDDFLWVRAQFGAGKSLAADRLFQQALRDYAEGKQTRIPVFLEAKALLNPLSEEIVTRAERLGAYYQQGVYAVIDGADERTHQQARELVQDAASYARAHPGSKVLITSSILEVSGLEPKLLPRLSKTEGDALLSRLTGETTFRHNYLDGRFAADLENPFFVIQCARFGTGLSRAELVRRMVAAALERVETAIQSAEDLLARLAQWQFDHGSPLVPERELGPSQAGITSVLQTRLLERRGECLSFTLECVAQWFEAKAIVRGLVSISDLLHDMARLERWQFALAMVLNRADADTADRIMAPLAETQPAFASLVLRDGLLDWGSDQKTGHVGSEEVARRLRDAMRAWKKGLEPVSSLEDVFPINSQGQLMKIAASSDDGHFMVNWHERPDLLDASVGAGSPFEPLAGDRNIFWYAGILDHPAWAWKTTHGNIKTALNKAIDETPLAAANERLLRELTWSEGCDLLGESKIRCNRVSISKVLEKLPFGFRYLAQRQLMEMYLRTLTESGAEFIEAPYPQSDEQPSESWMWQYFSHERMTLRAASVYETALIAYREIADSLFPKMAARFPKYAAWPFDLVGVVYLPDSNNSNGYALAWAMESLPAGSVGQTRFSPGTEKETAPFRKDWREMRELRDETKPSWHLQSWGWSELSLWGSTPAAEIIRRWISSDLKTVG